MADVEVTFESEPTPFKDHVTGVLLVSVMVLPETTDGFCGAMTICPLIRTRGQRSNMNRIKK